MRVFLLKKVEGQKEKLLVFSNFFFCHNVFKSRLRHMCQNVYMWESVNICIDQNYIHVVEPVHIDLV